MGGKIVVPEPDANIRKVVKNFQFNPKDISDFWKLFQKLDKEKSGLVPLADIFKSFETERNLLTDCLLELLDIEHEGDLNFSDFLLMVSTYCFFEPIEILKFCFFCFDQDKAGFFSIDDLNNLMNVAHNIKQGKTVKGTVKGSWMRLTFNKDEIDFNEFVKIHTAFPRLFEPAFRLQQLMMIRTKGEVWWTLKKRSLQDAREEVAAKAARVVAKKERKKQAKKNQKIQRNMGLVKYYLCPCYRADYDPSLSAYDKMSREEKEAYDKEMAKVRREAELKLKNPETAIWQKFEKKLARLEEQEEKGDEEEDDEEAEGKGAGNQQLALVPLAGAGAMGSASGAMVPYGSKELFAVDGAGSPMTPAIKNNGRIVPISSGVLDDKFLALDSKHLTSKEKEAAAAAKKPKKGGFLEKKLQTTQRPREDRAMSREERRQQRKNVLSDL